MSEQDKRKQENYRQLIRNLRLGKDKTLLLNKIRDPKKKRK